MKRYIKVFYLLLLVTNCTQPNDSFQSAPVENMLQIEIDKLNFDLITFDNISTSSFGESVLLPSNEIAFIDKYFCKVSIFDTLGNFQRNYLGLGGAPHETQIGRIAAQALLSDERLVLFGYNLDFHIFKDYITDDIFMLERAKNDILEASSYTYTNQYNDMVCRSYKNKMYFNVYSEHTKFNILEHTNRYLDKCRHIWEIDIDKKKDSRLLATGYPESYKEEPKKHVIFTGCCYDIDRKGNFYISYDTDSLIYVYNHDFYPLRTYGFEGKNMNNNYLSISDYKECRRSYRSERETKGYYYWLEYVDETALLFRSYRKSVETDGLQIYREGVLIADVDIPKGFRVMGYIAPYYYSYIIPKLDEDDDSLIIYKFKFE